MEIIYISITFRYTEYIRNGDTRDYTIIHSSSLIVKEDNVMFEDQLAIIYLQYIQELIHHFIHKM